MYKIIALVVIAFVVIAGSTVCMNADDAGKDAPSREFMSAALEHQLSSCGPSLNVEYATVFERRENGRLLAHSEKQYRYTRTAEAMRIDIMKDGKTIEQAFHNRLTKEYRLVSLDGVRPYAIQGQGFGDPFVNSEFLETAMYLLDRKPLYEWIRSATSITECDAVDGQACIRAVVPTGIGRPQRYVVWLDPSIGCNPRRIDVVHDENTITVIKYADYRRVAEECWFPSQMTLQYRIAKQNWDIQITSSVTEVGSGSAIPTEQLRPAIPSGMQVHAAGGEFIQP